MIKILNRKSILILLALIIVAFSLQPALSDKKEETQLPADPLKAGKMLYFEGNYEEAIKYFDEAFKSNPRDLETIFFRGATLYWLGKYKEANKVFDRALKINNRNHLVWYYKGKTLNALKNRKEALGCFEKAIEIKSDFKDAWFSKGMVMFASENYRQCITSMNRVLKLNPGDARALIFIGMSYYWLADNDKARYYISRGLTLDPSLKEKIPERIMEDLSRQQ